MSFKFCHILQSVNIAIKLVKRYQAQYIIWDAIEMTQVIILYMIIVYALFDIVNSQIK